jgi:hypothetical protein
VAALLTELGLQHRKHAINIPDMLAGRMPTKRFAAGIAVVADERAHRVRPCAPASGR